MSVSITLNKSMARHLDAVSSFTQYVLMIAGLLLLLGSVGLVFKGPGLKAGGISKTVVSVVPAASASPAQETAGSSVTDADADTESASISPNLVGALEYVKRRYRVSPEAVLPVFEVAELIGQERRIDPLLILAIIGVESGFNPFAESSMGARGLMQVIPRFHMDKVPDGTGSRQLFDPAVNIRVGVYVLEEAIRRRGGLTAGLQYYAGSSDSDGGYASKVLAEKARLEKAARRGSESNA